MLHNTITKDDLPKVIVGLIDTYVKITSEKFNQFKASEKSMQALKAHVENKTIPPALRNTVVIHLPSSETATIIIQKYKDSVHAATNTLVADLLDERIKIMNEKKGDLESVRTEFDSKALESLNFANEELVSLGMDLNILLMRNAKILAFAKKIYESKVNDVIFNMVHSMNTIKCNKERHIKQKAAAALVANSIPVEPSVNEIVKKHVTQEIALHLRKNRLSHDHKQTKPNRVGVAVAHSSASHQKWNKKKMSPIQQKKQKFVGQTNVKGSKKRIVELIDSEESHGPARKKRKS
jgi:hypothetical protein